jgi:hypothetical protein
VRRGAKLRVDEHIPNAKEASKQYGNVVVVVVVVVVVALPLRQ